MGLQIVYASTAGHTDAVLDLLLQLLHARLPDLRVTMRRAEQAGAEDLGGGDVLLLACGTWNTGGREGQLNPHMHEFLLKRAKEVNLQGRKVACIGLGDSRYRYTAFAAVRLEDFVKRHGGILFLPSLKIVNEPYGQEGKVRAWGAKLLTQLRKHESGITKYGKRSAFPHS